MVLEIVIDPNIGDLRQHDDFHLAIDRHRRRHAGRQTTCAGRPIPLAALCLLGETCLQDRLILGCERGLLSAAPRLRRIECRLPANGGAYGAPLA